MRKLILACVVALAIPSTYALASSTDGTVETRTHYVIRDANGTSVGAATSVFRFRPASNERFLLYRSSDGEELIIEDWNDYPQKEVGVKIRDPKGVSWIRSIGKLPFSGNTLDEVTSEFRLNPTLWNSMPDGVTFETNGGTWTGSRKAWDEPAARRQLTIALRRSLSFELLETIERTSGQIFKTFIGELAGGLIVDYLLYRPDCTTSTTVAMPAIPDCKFDASFGFTCSDIQQQRANDAMELGEVREQY